MCSVLVWDVGRFHNMAVGSNFQLSLFPWIVRFTQAGVKVIPTLQQKDLSLLEMWRNYSIKQRINELTSGNEQCILGKKKQLNKQCLFIYIFSGLDIWLFVDEGNRFPFSVQASRGAMTQWACVMLSRHGFHPCSLKVNQTKYMSSVFRHSPPNQTESTRLSCCKSS